MATMFRLTRGLSLLFLAANCGCMSYNWKLTYSEYASAETQARDQGKYMFIFFKYWLDSDSNRMIGEVLDDPKVKPLFQNTLNLLVEKEGGGRQFEEMKGKYGVKEPPASVIVAPDGKFVTREGPMTRDTFIEWAKQAMSGSPPPSSPTRKAPP